MYFELTEALIDDIVFSIEDQQQRFLLDAQDGILVSPEALGAGRRALEESRYVPLPEWDSSKGFRLMERFASSFKNAVVRQELSAALNRGKGVFRAFKDVLSRYPEAEKRWFAFKEREMKREILQWYNALRDAWGLEQIGGEPEETEELVLEDFVFREAQAQDAAAAQALREQVAGETGEAAFPQSPPEDGGGVCLVAETGGGEFAGYVRLIRAGSGLHVSALAVKPEFRGLGLGEALCSQALSAVAPPAHITIDLPAEAEAFSRVLLRHSFQPCLTRYCKKL